MTEQIQASEPGWLTLLGILSARNSIKLLIIGTAWTSVFITAGQRLPLEPSQRQKKRLMAQSRLIYWLFWMKYGRIGRRPLPPATIDFHSVFRLSAPLCKMPPSYFIYFHFIFSHSQLPLLGPYLANVSDDSLLFEPKSIKKSSPRATLFQDDTTRQTRRTRRRERRRGKEWKTKRKWKTDSSATGETGWEVCVCVGGGLKEGQSRKQRESGRCNYLSGVRVCVTEEEAH